MYTYWTKWKLWWFLKFLDKKGMGHRHITILGTVRGTINRHHCWGPIAWHVIEYSGKNIPESRSGFWGLEHTAELNQNEGINWRRKEIFLSTPATQTRNQFSKEVDTLRVTGSAADLGREASPPMHKLPGQLIRHTGFASGDSGSTNTLLGNFKL